MKMKTQTGASNSSVPSRSIQARVRAVTLLVKNIHAHVAVMFQRVGGAEHEHDGVQVGDRLLQGNRADVEQVAQDYHDECEQYHAECQPGHGATA